MSNNLFKEGDLVYYPPNKHIYSLVKSNDSDYPLTFITDDDIDLESVRPKFTLDGKESKHHKLSSIFHANEKSRNAIYVLHGLTMSEPPTNEEYVRIKLQEQNCSHVVCNVSSDSNNSKLELIVRATFVDVIAENALKKRKYTFYNNKGETFEFVSPVDNFGKPIITGQE